MKRLTALLLSALLVTSLLGCGADSAEEASNNAESVAENEEKSETENSGGAENSAGQERYLMGISLVTKEITYNTMVPLLEEKAKAYEEENGIKVEFSYTFCDKSMDTQIADVESLITLGCDAVAVRLTDTAGASACFDSIRNEGIPSIAMWNGGEGADYAIYVVDNYIIGQRQAEWLFSYLEDKPDLVLNVGYIDGYSTAADTLLRCTGFKEAVEAKYGDLTSGQIRFLDSDYSEGGSENAIKITEDWLLRYPEMNCIVGWNDAAAFGAIQACQGSNMTADDYVCVGADGQEYLDYIADGQLDMSIGINFLPAIDQLWSVLINAAEGDTDMAAEEANKVADTYFAIDADTLEEWKAMNAS